MSTYFLWCSFMAKRYDMFSVKYKTMYSVRSGHTSLYMLPFHLQKEDDHTDPPYLELWLQLLNGVCLLRLSSENIFHALTRALLGLWISHRLLGGGGVWTPPPMISAPGRRKEKRKAAFESSRKIISKSFRSFFGSGQNWGLQGSKFQNFPKRFFDNKIFNFKDRATNLIPLCLSR